MPEFAGEAMRTVKHRARSTQKRFVQLSAPKIATAHYWVRFLTPRFELRDRSFGGCPMIANSARQRPDVTCARLEVRK